MGVPAAKASGVELINRMKAMPSRGRLLRRRHHPRRWPPSDPVLPVRGEGAVRKQRPVGLLQAAADHPGERGLPPAGRRQLPAGARLNANDPSSTARQTRGAGDHNRGGTTTMTDLQQACCRGRRRGFGALPFARARAQAANTIRIALLCDFSGTYRDVTGPERTRLRAPGRGRIRQSRLQRRGDLRRQPEPRRCRLQHRAHWFDRDGVDVHRRWRRVLGRARGQRRRAGEEQGLPQFRPRRRRT